MLLLSDKSKYSDVHMMEKENGEWCARPIHWAAVKNDDGLLLSNCDSLLSDVDKEKIRFFCTTCEKYSEMINRYAKTADEVNNLKGDIEELMFSGECKVSNGKLQLLQLELADKLKSMLVSECNIIALHNRLKNIKEKQV